MLSEFKGQDPSLSGSTEEDFLCGIIKSFKENDQESFESIFSKFKLTNSGSFDEWRKVIFNKLYEKIKNLKSSGGYNIKSNDNHGFDDKPKFNGDDDFLG